MQPGALGRFLRRVVDVQDEEIPRLLLAFVYFFFLLGGYMVLRPIREEMGIRGGVERLPWFFTGTFFATLAVVPLWGALSARLPRRRLVPAAYRCFALCIFAFYLLLRFPATRAATVPALFIWISVYNLFVVSVFWSLMADLHRPEQARRLFGFIAAGGTTGALIGPLVTAALAPRIGPGNLLLLSAFMLEVAGVCARRLARGDAPASPPSDAPWDGRPTGQPGEALGGSIFAGIRLVAGSRYLLILSVHILLFTLTATFLYFQQAGLVARVLDDPGRRTALFARIDFMANALSLLVQALGTGWIIRRFGVAWTLASVPAVTLVCFACLAGVPGLGIMTAVMTLRRAAGFALERPARETLFTVMDREEKYKAKNVIDTLVYRAGDSASGWIHAALAAGGLGLTGVALVSLPVTGIWLLVALFLGRRQEALTRR